MPSLNAKTVKLTRQRTLLHIEPMPIDVCRQLATSEHVIASTPRAGVQIASVPKALCDDCTSADNDRRNPHGMLSAGTTLAGLEPVVRHLLRQYGYRIAPIVADPELPQPDLAAVQRHGAVDQELLDVVARHGRALVRYGHSVDRAWLIAQLALAFPALTIMVFCSRTHEAQVLAIRIRQWLPGTVTKTESSRIPREKNRIMVGTYQQMLGNCDIQQRDLFIALDAVEALGQLGVMAINAAWKARLLGFLPGDRELAPRDADHLRGFLGFQQVAIPAHGYKPLPVEVVFEKHFGPLKVENPEDQLSLRRNGIWHNPIWNRRIARLAKALQENDREPLRSFPGALNASKGRIATRVAVLVENVEQALALAEYLPGWPLCAGREINLKGLPRKARDLLASMPKVSANPNYAIFTSAALAQLDPNEFDVLVRADAGEGLPPLDEAKLIVPNGNQHRFLLLDYDDRRHDVLRCRTEKRKKAYREQGWYGVGADPVEERVKLFLRSRPKV